MAIFANSAATQTTAVPATTATVVFSTSATGIPTGVTLHDVIIENTGTVTIYLGSTSSVTSSNGLALQAGAQLTYNGYAWAQGASGGNIYAYAASATTVLAGLATVNSNV